MTVRPKIIFDHRNARAVEDVTDLMELLFPGNSRQRYAAARIVLSLKAAGGFLLRCMKLRRPTA